MVKLVALLGNYDRLNDQPTYRQTDLVIGKFHFQPSNNTTNSNSLIRYLRSKTGFQVNNLSHLNFMLFRCGSISITDLFPPLPSLFPPH